MNIMDDFIKAKKAALEKYFEKMIDGRLWLNPGSCGRSRFGGEVTMALMEIDNGNWNVRKINFSAGKRTYICFWMICPVLSYIKYEILPI